MTNVFLITADDLRADRIGFINEKSCITPNIDSFAKDNISFTNALAVGPMTPLSFPAILFSMYPIDFFRNKVIKNHSIASVLKEFNYKTAAFNSNPHFKFNGFDEGFEYFEDFLNLTKKQRDKPIEIFKKKIVKKLGVKNKVVKIMQMLLTNLSTDIALPYADAKTVNEYCLKWLKSNKNDNIFCWIHYMDTHYPFIPPVRYLNRSISNREILKLNRLHKRAEKYGEKIKDKHKKGIIKIYDAEVKYFDESFGLFLENLKKIGLYDDSVIIFTSDHGELFGEHNRFGHQYDVLYQKQLHVPLVIKTNKNNQKKINHPVSLVDIPSTILNILGMDDNYNGVDLCKKRRDYLISESVYWKSAIKNKKNAKGKFMVSCQKNNWKLIIDKIHGREELFNLDNDKDELLNLFEKETTKYQALKQIIINHLRKKKERKKRDGEKMLKKIIHENLKKYKI